MAVESDGFIQFGESAKGQIDESMLSRLNASLSEVGLDSRTFSFTSQDKSGAIKNLGSTTGVTKNMVGAVTTQGIANTTLHPNAVQGDLAASAFNLKNNAITPLGFLDFAQAENIKIGGHIDFDNMSAFVMDKGLLDPETLKGLGGLDTQLTQDTRALKTTLHEVGHVVGRKSGANATKDSALGKIQSVVNKITSGSGDLSNISREYSSSLIEHVREKALDEARAETFSYHTLSDTKTGQDFLENLKTVDFSTNILSDNGNLSRRYGQTFLDTSYYHFNQGSATGFDSYSSAGDEVETKLRNLGVNVEDARLRAQIHATGTVNAAVDFGEYSEVYNPMRQRISDINRQFILDTHGQEYADIYDEGVKFGEQNRYSVVATGDIPGKANIVEGTIDKPVGEGNLTEAGKARANVPKADKVLSAMDDDELTEYLKKSKDFVTEQSRIDPDGKAWKPQAEHTLKNVEKELRKRGIHPDDAGTTQAANNANKSIPLADEYDTGTTSAKVASGDPISTPPPSAPPKTPPPKGPSGLGTATNVKTQPGAHGGGGGRPPAPPRPPGPPPPPPGPPSPPPGPPTTSPTAPTAKIVTNTQGNNLTARDALRGIGDDIRAARKPGQRLLSADGSKAMAEAVTRGIKGSRNLKMLAVGSALGLAGYTANRVSDRDNPLDLEG